VARRGGGKGEMLVGGVCVRAIGGWVGRTGSGRGGCITPAATARADDPRGGGARPDGRRASHRRAGTRRGARVVSPRRGRTMTAAAATATAAVR